MSKKIISETLFPGPVDENGNRVLNHATIGSINEINNRYCLPKEHMKHILRLISDFFLSDGHFKKSIYTSNGDKKTRVIIGKNIYKYMLVHIREYVVKHPINNNMVVKGYALFFKSNTSQHGFGIKTYFSNTLGEEIQPMLIFCNGHFTRHLFIHNNLDDAYIEKLNISVLYSFDLTSTGYENLSKMSHAFFSKTYVGVTDRCVGPGINCFTIN